MEQKIIDTLKLHPYFGGKDLTTISDIKISDTAYPKEHYIDIYAIRAEIMTKRIIFDFENKLEIEKILKSVNEFLHNMALYEEDKIYLAHFILEKTKYTVFFGEDYCTVLGYWD